MDKLEALLTLKRDLGLPCPNCDKCTLKEIKLFRLRDVSDVEELRLVTREFLSIYLDFETVAKILELPDGKFLKFLELLKPRYYFICYSLEDILYRDYIFIVYNLPKNEFPKSTVLYAYKRDRYMTNLECLRRLLAFLMRILNSKIYEINISTEVINYSLCINLMSLAETLSDIIGKKIRIKEVSIGNTLREHVNNILSSI